MINLSTVYICNTVCEPFTGNMPNIMLLLIINE